MKFVAKTLFVWALLTGTVVVLCWPHHPLTGMPYAPKWFIRLAVWLEKQKAKDE